MRNSKKEAKSLDMKKEKVKEKKFSNKKELITLLLIFVVVLAIIGVIFYFKEKNPENNDSCPITEETINCIANKSILIASPTCPHCAEQEDILAGNISCFKVYFTNKEEGMALADKYGVEYVPAWIINEKVNYGVKTIEQLKEMTGC
jgi:hypothetical protein